MARYIVKRIAQMIPLLIGISIVIFGIIQAAPGGPEGTLLDRGMFVDPAAIDAYRAKLGVDKPLYLQYLRWAGAILGGDMGVSFQTLVAFVIMALAMVVSRLAVTGLRALQATERTAPATGGPVTLYR